MTTSFSVARLNAIIGMADLLAELELEETGRLASVEEIRGCGRHPLQIVSASLAFADAESAPPTSCLMSLIRPMQRRC